MEKKSANSRMHSRLVPHLPPSAVHVVNCAHFRLFWFRAARINGVNVECNEHVRVGHDFRTAYN